MFGSNHNLENQMVISNKNQYFLLDMKETAIFAIAFIKLNQKGGKNVIKQNGKST